MKPLDVLDQQVSLLHWWRSQQGDEFGVGWAKTKPDGSTPVPMNQEWESSPVAEAQAWTLQNAPTYWVSEEMQILSEHAAQTMPRQPLKLTDLPTPFGFAFFDQPVIQADARGEQISWRAFAWAPASTAYRRDGKVIRKGKGVALSYYTDMLKKAPGELDEVTEEWKALNSPRLVMVHNQGWLFDEAYEPADKYDRDDVMVESDDEAALIIQENEFWTRKFVLAFWTIAQQKIALRSAHPIPRPWMRRAQRANVESPSITVVDLRRVTRESGEPSGEGVAWDHRWIVSGHWRRQYLPSVDSHRLQWVAPYVKGPEERPLIVKDRIFRVVR